MLGNNYSHVNLYMAKGEDSLVVGTLGAPVKDIQENGTVKHLNKGLYWVPPPNSFEEALKLPDGSTFLLQFDHNVDKNTILMKQDDSLIPIGNFDWDETASEGNVATNDYEDIEDLL